MNQGYNDRAREETDRIRSAHVIVVHMNDGAVKVIKNRFGISGNTIPSKEQWAPKLTALRETHGDFRLWEMTHWEADRILKGRMNW